MRRPIVRTCAFLGLLSQVWVTAAIPVVLETAVGPDQQIRLEWPVAAGSGEIESTDALGRPFAPIAGAPVLQGDRWVLSLPIAEVTRFFRLRLIGAAAQTVIVTETSPADGESGVAVTRETVFRLSGPLSADTVLTTNQVYAIAGGRRVLSRVELGSDRRTATLFYLEPLPASAQVAVTLDGTGIFDTANQPVDFDGDGVPGGQATIRFNTLTTTPLGTTGIEGRVYASAKSADGSNLALEGVTITVDGQEETLRTTTDANGFFRLQPAPAGRFFVHVDGRTAIDSQWPGGAYYPFVGKAWETVPGRTNNLAGGTGEIFLPRIGAEALKPVSPNSETRVTFATADVAANPALAGVEINVPANALFADDGTRGGRVGLAPVPPDRLPEPLPPGLNLPLVITIQTDGPMNFDQPVPVKFPNLPDPVTGVRLPPGAKTAIWSFNHDVGRWEIQGPATVSADGQFAVSDPGVGIRQPGWHGVAPGSSGGGPGGGPPGPPDCSGPDCKKFKDCSKEAIKGLTGGMELAMDLVLLPKELGHPFNGKECALGFAKDLAKSFVECWAYEDFDPGECGKGFAEDGAGAGLGCIPYVGPLAKAFWDTYLWVNDLKDLEKCQGGGGAAPTLHAIVTDRRPAAAGATGPLATAIREFESQLEVSHATSNYLAHLLVSPRWTGPDEPAEAEAYARLWNALFAALDPAGPGGATLTDVERASLRALPRPNGATATELDALLDQVTWLATEVGDEPYRAALRPVAEAYIHELETRQSAGWATPVDGLKRGLLAYTAWQQRTLEEVAAAAGGTGSSGGAGAGGGATGGSGAVGAGPSVPLSPPHWSIIILNLETGFSLRTTLNASGKFENVFLAPEAFHLVLYVDPVRNEGGAGWFQSAPAGQETRIPSVLVGPLPAGDLDGDGVADFAEQVLGTRPDLADSDGDGVPDGEEWANRTNPLDGQAMGQGPVATRPLPGTALAIATDGDLAFVGLGTEGVAIFEVANPLDPVLLSRTRWTGVNVEAVAAAAGMLAVGNTNGVRLLRVGDGRAPVEVVRFRTYFGSGTVTPPTLAAAGRWLYVPGSSNGVPTLSVIDSEGPRLEGLLALPETNGPLSQLRIEGPYLWSLQGANGRGRLTSHRIDGGDLAPAGQLELTGLALAPLERAPDLFVAQGRAYIGDFNGLRIVDTSDPTAPRLIIDPAATQTAVHDLALTGSGRLLSVSSFRGPSSLALSLYDIRADDPFNVLTSWDTPGQIRAVVLHRAYALAADGPAGLAVVNYLSERGPLPPTVTLSAIVSHPPRAQESGNLFRLTTTTTDDVQVREVEFYLEETLVGRSGRFPFEVALRAPPRTAERTNLVARARAIDTFGNAVWSDPLEIALLPDVSPPRLFGVLPADGAVLPRGSLPALIAEFNEPLDLSALATGWSLVEAGPDDALGTADDVPVPGGRVRQEPGSFRAFLDFGAPLPSGRYRASLITTIRDFAGNGLPVGREWQFRIPFAAATRSRPENGAVQLTGSTSLVSVEFDEVLRGASVTPATLQLIGAGPDGILGNADDTPVPPAAATADGRSARLTFGSPLPDGTYRFRLQRGLLDVYGGAVLTTFNATFSVKGPVLWAVDRSGAWDVGTNWSTRARPATRDHVIIDRPAGAYVVTQAVAATVTTLRSAEAFVLNGAALTAVERATFDAPVTLLGGGRFNGPWTEFNAGVSVPSGTANRFFDGLVRNAGVFHWQAGGLLLWFNTTFHNLPTGTFLIEKSDGFGLAGSTETITARFLNEGVIRKVGVGSPIFLSGVALENRGRIEVGAGTLELRTATTNLGSIEVGAGSRIDLGAGLTPAPFVQSPPGRLTGEGTVVVRSRGPIAGEWAVSGTTAISNGLAATFVSPLRTHRLIGSGEVILSDGGHVGLGGYEGRLEFSGRGRLRVEGPLRTASMPVTGNLEVRTESSLDLSGSLSLSRTSRLETLGPVTLTPAGRVTLSNRATWEVAPGATVDLPDGARVAASMFSETTNPLWLNRGLVRKAATPGVVQVNGWMDNVGELRVDGGRLEADGLRLRNSGTISVADEAGLWFSDGFQEFAAGSSLRGGGLARFVSRQRPPNLASTARFLGEITLPRLIVTNTLVEFPVGGALSTLELGPYGYVSLGADFVIREQLQTTTGSRIGPVAGASGVTVESRGTAEFRAGELTEGARLRHLGAGQIRGRFTLQSQAHFLNQPGAELILGEAADSIAPEIRGTGVFENQGLLIVDSLGVTWIGAFATNTGTLEIRRGAVRLTRQWTHADGEIRLTGGRLELDTDSTRPLPPLVLAGGRLTGAGSIVFTNDNTGSRTLTNELSVLRPGLPIGVLSIGDSYAQAPGGTLEMELGGTTPGTGHDQIAVARQARLSGTLRVQLRDGFIPEVGQEFVVLTAQTVGAERFATVDLPSLPAGRRLEVVYQSSRVLVRCVAGP